MQTLIEIILSILIIGIPGFLIIKILEIKKNITKNKEKEYINILITGIIISISIFFILGKSIYTLGLASILYTIAITIIQKKEK